MAEIPEFSIGTVVILRSGSPQMTVHGVGDYGPDHPNPGILCIWFHESKRYEAVFDPRALIQYD